MLFNSEGKKVSVSFDAHRRVITPLREVLEPEHACSGKLFNMEQRARITDKR